MDAACAQLLETSNGLFSNAIRTNMLNLWQESAEIYYPARADFLREFNPTLVVGENMESTPQLVLRDLANYISLFRDKFKIRTLNEDIDEIPHVADWQDKQTEVLKRALRDRRSQYKRATKQADNDYVAFGNLVISVEESPTRDHFLFRNHHLRDCAWAENPIGEIDRLDRKMKMTARNMKRLFKDTCPQAVLEACEKTPTKEFEIRHIVLPSDEHEIAGKKSGKKLPYCSIYVDVENGKVLKEGYLPDFMYVVARWHLVSGCPYAFSPPAIAGLPDGRMVNMLARIILEAGEKAIDPPMIALSEVIRSDINLYAGGITVVDSEYDEKTGKPLQQAQTMGDIRLGVEMREDVRKLLNDAFYLSKLFLPNEREMTAEEASIRNQEFIRTATPIFDPLDEVYHAPLLDKAFSLLLRTPAIDKTTIPDELAGKDVQFLFDNPVKQAESRLKLVAAQEVLQVVGAIKVENPNAPSKVDWDALQDDAMRGANAQADWFADPEQVAAENAQAAQDAAIQKAAGMVQAGASVGGDVANATMAMQQAGIV